MHKGALCKVIQLMLLHLQLRHLDMLTGLLHASTIVDEDFGWSWMVLQACRSNLASIAACG